VNFDGYQPQTLPRIGSLVQSDDVTELPLGIASEVQNCSYRAQSGGVRDGVGIKLVFGEGNSVVGLGMLRYLAADNSGQENISLVACTKDGNVWSASPFSQGTVKQLTDSAMIALSGISLMPGISPQCAQAYNKMLVAQGDLMTGKGPVFIIDGATLTCDPISDKPFGDAWQPLTRYRQGNVVSPTGNVVDLYYCQQGGMSAAAEPIWPLVEDATVIDGSGVGNIVWRKLVILCTSGLQPPPVPIKTTTPAGTLIPAGATLFLVCTWTNQFGESIATVVNPDGTIGSVLQYKNTTGAAQDINIVLPPVPADIAVLPLQYAVLTCNVYGYLVAGVPDPAIYLDPTSYAFMTSGAPGSTVLLSSVPVGDQLPQANNAFTTAPGNVALGVRYMIVLYEDRNGYICGFSGPAPIRCDISVDSRQMFVQNLPIGPYNCVARICAFTVAGQGSAGPYFYISEDDYEDPGLGQAKIKQTATKIPDNITTSAYFDFLDSYLPGASEVTDYFDRIELPFCSDVYFSKSLNRVAYGGVIGYPSAFLVSDIEDSGAVRVPGSIVQVSQTDGDRAVCWRESGTLQVAYKENSAHSVTPNDGDPQDWSVNELWRGCGPCNPRAIDTAFDPTAKQKLTAFVHRTGGYTWDGGGSPVDVTTELKGTPDQPGVWDRINWAASQVIAVTINFKERLAYFFVPLDGATQNSHRLTLDFFYGLDEPIIFIVRTGREVPNITGRKWSVDSIPGTMSVYVPQRTSSTVEV
jgi:hypothetical protein